MAGDNRGASSWSGGEKTRNVDKVSDKTLVAIYSRTASELRKNVVTETIRMYWNTCVHMLETIRMYWNTCVHMFEFPVMIQYVVSSC